MVEQPAEGDPTAGNQPAAKPAAEPAPEQPAEGGPAAADQPAAEPAPEQPAGAQANTCEDGQHKPDLTQPQPKNYTACGGGYQTATYPCTVCGARVKEDGSFADWVDGSAPHTLGEKHAPDYTPCGGGYKTEWYSCAACGIPVDAAGARVTMSEPVSGHTPGDRKYAADYTPCSGGFKTDYYLCTGCGACINAAGEGLRRLEGTGKHTPGGQKHAPDYTPCGGGYTTEFYNCTVCGATLDANGKYDDLHWAAGADRHQPVGVPAAAPTYEEDGCLAHWECSACHALFADSEGTKEVYLTSLRLPKLTRDTQVKVESLNTVPANIITQYDTVEQMQTALLDTAKEAGFAPDQAGAGSVLLDVTLQIKNPDGSLTAVRPEDFPAEGVTVLLPYPAGTDQSYTFFITHMITHGARAGQVEVLRGLNAQDGIYVHFSSMSPVCISYLPQTSAPAPGPAPAAPVSAVPKTNDPNHGAPWGPLALLSLSGLAALCILGKKQRSLQ